MANRLLKRVRDYARLRDNRITHEVATEALSLFEIDDNGLDHLDRRILQTIQRVFGGGPSASRAWLLQSAKRQIPLRMSTNRSCCS